MKLRRILERWLDGARAPYYHFTDSHQAVQIVEDNAIGSITYDVIQGAPGSVDVVKRFTTPQWVSLTRDKKYRVKGHASTIAFELNGERLQHNFKMEPHADRFAIGPRPGSLGGERAEAEEVVRSVIKPLDKYLISIYIDNAEWNKLKDTHARFLQSANREFEDEDLSRYDKLDPEKRKQRITQAKIAVAKHKVYMAKEAKKLAALIFHPKVKKGLP